MTRKIGIASRYGGGLLVVVHIRAPQQPRLGATAKLLRELAALEVSARGAVAARAGALKLYLQGYPTDEACAVAGVTPIRLRELARKVRDQGVAPLLRVRRRRLGRRVSPELRAELGVLAEEASPEGRVARALCLYLDGAAPEKALADAGIPHLHLQYLVDCVRDRGTAYLRHRFRNGNGWRKRYTQREGGPRKKRSEQGPVASSGEGSLAAAAQPPPEEPTLNEADDTRDTPRPGTPDGGAGRWKTSMVT
jgi:hypothetical protein